eukprot:TRINITY_DN85105_c0_g1_i1.p1 TRINITY_DN85105_c0_g1~~TRINITY_DN85105_c0_g1_i1.p1  ORF type:complete len:260 (-),score=52.51 TRINITY_DN85105_c0_g1_i1:12-791(-)
MATLVGLTRRRLTARMAQDATATLSQRLGGAAPPLLGVGVPAVSEGLFLHQGGALPGQQLRHFGIKRVRQRRRSRGRLIHPKQTHYVPKPDDYEPLPLSLLSTGNIRRVLKAGTQESKELIGGVDWERYKSGCPGVRWHPVGGWRVQFNRRNYEHNFFVKCSAYFRVALYGFDHGKDLAVAYRKRLEAEWAEQERIWYRMDSEREANRLQRKAAKQAAARLEDGGDGYGAAFGENTPGTGDSLWGVTPMIPPASGVAPQ